MKNTMQKTPLALVMALVGFITAGTSIVAIGDEEQHERERKLLSSGGQPMLNRRVPEAQSLRDFFHSQWVHLESLFNHWQYQRAFNETQKRSLDHAIDQLVTGTDKRLRSIASYREQLRASTRQLLEHVDSIVTAMPRPYVLDQHTLIHDPEVKLLFRDRHYLNELFANSWALKRDLGQQAATLDHLYTLIVSYKDEKRILGSEIHGNMIVRDVMQTMVNFVGHTIVSAHENESALRAGAKQFLFDNIVAHLHKETVRARVQLQMEQQSQPVAPQDSIDNPSVYLALLKRMLAEPMQLVRVEEHQLVIDQMGIKVATQAHHTSAVEQLQVRETTIGDGRAKVLSLALYPQNVWSRQWQCDRVRVA